MIPGRLLGHYLGCQHSIPGIASPEEKPRTHPCTTKYSAVLPKAPLARTAAVAAPGVPIGDGAED